MPKQKVGELMGTPIVQGDPNIITKNEILFKKKKGIISLIKRDDSGEFKELTSGGSATTPETPPIIEAPGTTSVNTKKLAECICGDKALNYSYIVLIGDEIAGIITKEENDPNFYLLHSTDELFNGRQSPDVPDPINEGISLLGEVNDDHTFIVHYVGDKEVKVLYTPVSLHPLQHLSIIPPINTVYQEGNNGGLIDLNSIENFISMNTTVLFNGNTISFSDIIHLDYLSVVSTSPITSIVNGISLYKWWTQDNLDDTGENVDAIYPEYKPEEE